MYMRHIRLCRKKLLVFFLVYYVADVFYEDFGKVASIYLFLNAECCLAVPYLCCEHGGAGTPFRT